MPITPPVDYEDAPAAAQTVLDDIIQTLGRHDAPVEFKMMTGSPAFMRDAFTNQRALLKGDSDHLDTKTREAITLAVSTANGCTNCVKSHARSAQRAGWSADNTAAILGIAATCAMLNAYHTAREMADDPGLSPTSHLSFNCIEQPDIDKLTAELICVAVSALNHCHACLTHHKQQALAAGSNPDQLRETIKVAAAMTQFNVYFRVQH